MLANNLTLDEEDAVQEEFKELQALTVGSPLIAAAAFPLTHIFRLLRPDRRKLPNSQTFQTRNPSVSRLQVPYHSILSPGDPRLTAHSRTPSGGTSSGAGARSCIGCCVIYPRIFFTCNTGRVARFLYDTLPVDTMEMKVSQVATTDIVICRCHIRHAPSSGALHLSPLIDRFPTLQGIPAECRNASLPCRSHVTL